MARPILAAFCLLSLIAGSGAQAPDSGFGSFGTSFGTIRGRVTLKTRLAGTALPSTAYPTRATSTRETYPIPEIRNVVVSLKNAAYRGALPLQRAELRQEHETFVPHVVAVTRGSTVLFPNEDPIFHSVFSLSSAAIFYLGRCPQGDSRGQTLTKTGIVKVYCQIHSHMSATIVVFDHPYFAIPGPDGTYELPNVPVAEHLLVGWHERVGEQTVPVRVERGKITTVDLSLPFEPVR